MPNLLSSTSDIKYQLSNIIRQFKTFNEWNFNEDINYHITEYFPVNGKRMYELINLSGELDDNKEFGVVNFFDVNETLGEDMTRVLNIIPLSEIMDIIRYYSNDTHTYNSILILKGGCIRIETIPSI